MQESLFEFAKKRQAYLDNYYNDRGVGETVEQRVKHFKSLASVVYSREIPQHTELKLFEEELLELNDLSVELWNSKSVESKRPVQYNECKTCQAKDGRAGLLINDECENCYKTRTSGAISVFTYLKRTNEELQRTCAILDDKKEIELNEN